ncbi:MAG: hypothetical protein AAF558_01620 [Verrucomicrobiota bacterium]
MAKFLGLTALGILLTHSLLANQVKQSPQSNFVAWEAEACATNMGFERIHENSTPRVPPEATENAALYCSNQTGGSAPVSPKNIVGYKIVFSSPGSYSIYIRYYAPGDPSPLADGKPASANNSIWLPKGFGTQSPTDWIVAHFSNTPNTFIWKRMMVTLNVTQDDTGKELLMQIGGREKNVILDRIVLSLDDSLASEDLDGLKNSEFLNNAPAGYASTVEQRFPLFLP